LATETDQTEDTELLSALAWAIWQSENADDRPDDQEDRIKQWQEAKMDAMSKAINVSKRLQNRGVTLSLG